MSYGDWAQWRRRYRNVLRRMEDDGPSPGYTVRDEGGREVEPESTEWAKLHGWTGAYTTDSRIVEAVKERR